MFLRQHRVAVALVCALVLIACGKASMSGDQATQVAVDAFDAAGLDAEVGEIVEDATVDRAGDGAFIQVHQVEMIVDDRSYLAGVNKKEGAVVRLIEPNDTALTEGEVAAIAAHRDNPAEDAARRTRTIVWLVIVVLGIVGVVVYFQRERRKAELDGEDDDLIPLT